MSFEKQVQLVRAGNQLINALERCIKWGGSGGTRQAQAYKAREKAEAEWQALAAEVEEDAKRIEFDRRVDQIRYERKKHAEESIQRLLNK